MICTNFRSPKFYNNVIAEYYYMYEIFWKILEIILFKFRLQTQKKNGTMNFWPYYFYKFNNEMRVGEDQFILVINEFEAGNIENRNWIIIIN